MSSWRRTTSQQTQAALDALCAAATDLAAGLVEQHGGFVPFAVALHLDDEMAVVAADPGLGERPPSVAALHDLVRGLRRDRDELAAVALVSDVCLVDGSDALHLALEHRDLTAISVVVPHRRRRFPRAVVLGEATAAPGEIRVWGSEAD